MYSAGSSLDKNVQLKGKEKANRELNFSEVVQSHTSLEVMVVGK